MTAKIEVKPQHTPTPLDVAISLSYSVATPETKAYIVRAVNCHEALLEACKDVLLKIESGKDIGTGILIDAIAKAKGRS